MKLPKFLLCENPIADKSDGRIFILHTKFPKLIAEVFHLEIEDEKSQMECKQAFATGASLEYGTEYIVFGAIWIEQHAEDVDKLAGLMRRMADWYEAYLVWEDAQDHEGVEGKYYENLGPVFFESAVKKIKVD